MKPFICKTVNIIFIFVYSMLYIVYNMCVYVFMQLISRNLNTKKKICNNTPMNNSHEPPLLLIFFNRDKRMIRTDQKIQHIQLSILSRLGLFWILKIMYSITPTLAPNWDPQTYRQTWNRQTGGIKPRGKKLIGTEITRKMPVLIQYLFKLIKQSWNLTLNQYTIVI